MSRDHGRARWRGSAGGGAFVGPFDAHATDLAIACSVSRRLLSSYAGPLIRLRRSSDDAETDIGYDANGLLDTAAAANFIGGGSGFGVTLYDQSGGGHHLTQGTSVSQPAYQATGFQSKPTLSFDGNNDTLAAVNVPIGVFSFYLAGHWDVVSAAAADMIYHTGSGGFIQLRAGETSDFLWVRRSAGDSSKSQDLRLGNSTATIVGLRFGGTLASFRMLRNGSAVSLSNGYYTGEAGTAKITGTLTIHGPNYFTAGQTSEFFIYDVSHGDADHSAIGGIMNTHFAVY